jgi:hypothetical protein
VIHWRAKSLVATLFHATYISIIEVAMRRSGLISEINQSKLETWEDKIFLTFDIDWAHDEIIQDVFLLVQQYDVRATWFFTHASPMIAMLKDAGHEVGIHPNFNPLLLGNSEFAAAEIIERCFEWSGDATAARSHSLVYGAPIAQSFSNFGISHSSNLSIPSQSEIILKPWRSTSGIIEVPYSWADEFTWSEVDQVSVTSWASHAGLLVADFHPIHIYLNSTSSAVYEELRPHHQNPSRLYKSRELGLGTRTELIRICEMLS